MVRSRFNLSAWALEHQPLLRYLMVVLLIGGAFAFTALGQDEDPPFTFRAMVVRAYWPGATAQQMAEQVTDKIEKTLQEVPYADKIRSYTKPGESLTILEDSTDGLGCLGTPLDGIEAIDQQFTLASSLGPQVLAILIQ